MYPDHDLSSRHTVWGGLYCGADGAGGTGGMLLGGGEKFELYHPPRYLGRCLRYIVEAGREKIGDIKII